MIKQPKQRQIGIYNDENNCKEFFVSEEIITTKPQIIQDVYYGNNTFKQSTVIETTHLKRITSDSFEESSLTMQDTEIFPKLLCKFEKKMNCNLSEKYFNLNSSDIENIENILIYSHTGVHLSTTVLKGVYQDKQVAIKTKQPIS